MRLIFTKSAPRTYTTTMKDAKGALFVAIKSIDGLFWVYTHRPGSPVKCLGYFRTLREAKTAVQDVQDRVSKNLSGRVS